MKIDHKAVGRILLECLIVWIVFVWSDGAVLKFLITLITSGKNILVPLAQNIFKFLKYISPYSRDIVKESAYFRLQLDRSSFAAVLSFIVFLNLTNTKAKEYRKFWKCLFGGLLVWYCLYFNCYLITMIPSGNIIFIWVSLCLATLILILAVYNLLLKKWAT